MLALVSSTRKFSPSPTPILTSVVCKNGSIVGAHEVWRGGTFQSVEHREQESSLSCLDSTPSTIALPTVVRAGDRVLHRTQAIRDLPVSSSEGDEVQEWCVKGVHRTSMTMVGTRISAVSNLCVDGLCRNTGRCGTMEIPSPVNACPRTWCNDHKVSACATRRSSSLNIFHIEPMHQQLSRNAQSMTDSVEIYPGDLLTM